MSLYFLYLHAIWSCSLELMLLYQAYLYLLCRIVQSIIICSIIVYAEVYDTSLSADVGVYDNERADGVRAVQR